MYDHDDPDSENSHESSKGTFFPVADFTNWRIKCKDINNLKLDDVAKERYLVALAETGKRGIAAAAAGVDCSTITKHMSVDPEFMQAAEVAWDHYREQRVLRIENEAINGFEETIFSPTGEKGTRKRYETQLRVMILKAYDPEKYGDKAQQLDVNFKGGAVVIPLTPTADEWDKQFEAHREYMALPEPAAIDTVGYSGDEHAMAGNINKNTDLSKV
jgi:hypothetical protein